MGNSQSSHGNAKTTKNLTSIEKPVHKSSEVVRGRKSIEEVDSTGVNEDLNVEVELASTTDDSDVSYDRDVDDDEDMDDVEAGLEERRQILEDAKMLKQYATFHLRPEQPVVTTDAFVLGRNFFSRPSAEEQIDEEDIEERARIMEEAKLLKSYATFHLHPEKPVETVDMTACARNYFMRASAEEEETDAEEATMILEEARMFKQYATFHLHPEKKVETTDATACGRNYFSRCSAEEQTSVEDEQERVIVLEEVQMLKKQAEYHFHPEKPVEFNDATACGRNYFGRPSAEEQELEEDMDERDAVLAETMALKKHAEFHLHPEKPVVCDDKTAFGRNYFSRGSAPEQESLEDAEESVKILEEVKELRRFAGYHVHPERPVESSDPTVCGRNYFMRASATEQDSEDEDERAQILEETLLLKMYADFHLHPEKPVEFNDATACARNYFGRPSAEEQTSSDAEDERERILNEAATLKEYATFHLHPEKPVATSDATACGRNYFSRASAEDQEDVEDDREQILADCIALKQFADFHLHPEKPVTTSDATACGRNFFGRISAPEYLDEDEAEEREQVLSESSSLGMYAKYHLHPELPVGQADAAAYGRNYFGRASAADTDTAEETEERAQILEEAALLKSYAGFHLHPEKPVETNDASAAGRNYFLRASAEPQVSFEDMEEAKVVLEEARMLKQYATFHLHPEKKVETTDATACGRNYFSRASAEEQASVEDEHERIAVLEEIQMLKKQSEYHFHPEKPVECSDPAAYGRNFFNRPSAQQQESEEETEEREAILAECMALKKYAEFHLHPEKPVVCNDASVRARNYFSRASADANDKLITCEGRAMSIAHVQATEEDGYDNFEVAEELMGLTDFRASLTKVVSQRLAENEYLQPIKEVKINNGEDEGNMSRSPSSIMLFGYEENPAF